MNIHNDFINQHKITIMNHFQLLVEELSFMLADTFFPVEKDKKPPTREEKDW